MEKTSPETMAKESSEKAGMSAAGAEFAARASRWTEATRERVRRNPFASIGVAVGAALGMVLAAGLWFQRRERWNDRETHAH